MALTAINILALQLGQEFTWPSFMNATGVDYLVAGYTFDANGGSLVTRLYFASGRIITTPINGSGASVVMVVPTGNIFSDWFETI